MPQKMGTVWIAAALAGTLLFESFAVTSLAQDAAAEKPKAAKAKATEAPPEADAPKDAQGVPADEKSPLAGEPQTPDELFEAILLMVDIVRPKLAKTYLDQLMKQAPGDDVLLELRDKYGAVAFLKLANTKELQPASGKLLDQSNAAAAKRASDPERIARLVKQLGGTPDEKVVALEELRASGPVVLPALLNVLGDPERSALHEPVLQSLVQLNEAAVPVLIGALDSPLPDLRAHAATALGYIGSPTAIPYLWYPAMAPDELPLTRTAAREALAASMKLPVRSLDSIAGAGIEMKLVDLASKYYHNEIPWPKDDQGLVTLWTWIPRTETVSSIQVSPEIASEIVGARFARQAIRLAPESRKMQVTYLSLALAADARRAGWGKPLPSGPGTARDLALSVGADVMQEVLRDALDSGMPRTAIAALNVLEQIGTRAQLSGRSPVTAALNYPDERVQFAAASTILQMDPQTTFASAPRVVAILDRALTTARNPKVLVIDSSAEHAGRVGGIFSELGYDPLVVSTGREGFRAAMERSDVELIAINPNVIRWPLSETLANLRADARTANIPIVIHGPGDLRPKMDLYVKNYRRVMFAGESQTSSDVELQIRSFLQRMQTPPLSQEERGAQKAAAAFWFAHIAEARRTKIFDITGAEAPLRALLTSPDLVGFALEAISEIPSAGSQQILAEIAVDASRQEPIRRAATLKLAFHIQRFGLLLKSDWVKRLHAAWSAATDADLHAALGGVIGTLKPDAPLVGERLKQDRGTLRSSP